MDRESRHSAIVTALAILFTGVFLYCGSHFVSFGGLGRSSEKSVMFFRIGSARRIKPLFISFFKPPEVFLGGSRALQQLDPAIHSSGVDSYNGAISAATPYEIRRFAEHAILEGGAKKLLISLAFVTHLMPKKVNHGFNESILKPPGAAIRSKYIQGYEYVTQLLILSRGRLLKRDASEKEEYFDSSGVQVINSLNSSCATRSEGFYRADLENYLEKYSGYAASNVDGGTYEENLYHLISVLLLAQERNVEVDLVILPVHDSSAATRAIAGLTDKYLAWIQDVSRIANDHGVKSMVAYEEIAEITNEPFLPTDGCAGMTLGQWRNPSHALPEIGKRLRVGANLQGDLVGTNVLDPGALEDYLVVARRRYTRLKTKCTDIDGLVKNCFN